MFDIKVVHNIARIKMSYCKAEGKDTVIFVTKEDHKEPSTVTLAEDEEKPGLILPNGDINWACPCLGGMATGPCGFEFRDAFSCFHYSETDPKGSDCYEQFRTMQTCMAKYPDLYGDDDDNSADKMKEGDIDEVLDIMNPDEDESTAEQEVDDKQLSQTSSATTSDS